MPRRLIPLFAVTLTSLAIVACGPDIPVGEEGAQPPPRGQTGGGTQEGGGTSSSSGSTQPPAPSGPVPKLFVRGFGTSFDKVAPSLRSFETYIGLLEAEGFPREHAHDLGNYDDGKPLAEMSAEVGNMLLARMQAYPEGTKFDVMGHSLGGILALRAILDLNLHTRVRTFVALSSPVRGQDSQPLNCTLKMKCTDVYEIYNPFDNEVVKAYMAANAEKLAAMTLCSEISPDDGVIKSPMEGGQFVGGKNVVVPKVNHLDIIKKPEAVKALKDGCFGGAF